MDFHILLLLVFLQYAERQIAAESEGPVIIPNYKEIRVNVPNLFTLKCSDTEEIAWKCPEGSKAIEIEYHAEEKERPFGRELTQWDVGHYVRGKYYCVRTKDLKKSVSLLTVSELTYLDNNKMASVIYVYPDPKTSSSVNKISLGGLKILTANSKNISGAPLIIPQAEKIELPQSTDFTLNCKDKEAIAWKYPEKSNSKETIYLPRTNERLHGKLLTLSNANYFTNGNYYCVRTKVLSKNISLIEDSELTELVNRKMASMIHVFVNAPLYVFSPIVTVHLANTDTIRSDSQHYTSDGDTFNLSCYFRKYTGDSRKYKIKWILPRGLQWDETRMFVANISYSSPYTQFISNLTVTNAKLDDTGIYTCHLADELSDNATSANSTYPMWVIREERNYIVIGQPNNLYKINEKFNKTIQLTVRYGGFPWPTLKWYDPQGLEILNNEKFEIFNEGVYSTLKIYNTHLWDTGIYVVEATNPFKLESRQFNVTIEDVPIVIVEESYAAANETAHVQCKVQSLRKPETKWIFEPCSIEPIWPSCSGEFIKDFDETSSSNRSTNMEFIYDLYFVPKSSGKIRCSAKNYIGTTIGESRLLVHDISENMTIFGIEDDDIIALGDRVAITCAALGIYFRDDIYWYNSNGRMITETENIEISEYSSPYSFRKTLTFKKIKYSDEGRYECRARHLKDLTTERRTITITAHQPLAPRMSYTNLDDGNEMKLKLGENIELKCESESIPKATVKWYKNEQLMANEGTVLSLSLLKPEDEGQYKCVVTNRLGSIKKSIQILITDIPVLSRIWLTGILLIFILSIILVIYFYFRVKRTRKSLTKLTADGFENFESGNLEHINPFLTLNEQADLLPYDRGFEFPKDKLKLGKQLGAGAFGVVLKAGALGLVYERKETTVAVKMVKRQANNEVMKALASELKIMVHLGKHLNVVNLLGAVTKNIAKRELMVLVEYCPYGNIRNFLIRNRERFINQINSCTDSIELSTTIGNLSDDSNLDGNMKSCYSVNKCSTSSGYVTQSEISRGQANEYTNDPILNTSITQDDDNTIVSKSNNPGENMTITTTDLVSWAFQISFGMEYLSSKNVLHGDLAARNILLSDDNIVKICDFGLSRSMYERQYYRKQPEALLPIKWLALESFSDHIFSTYTDVWSFGIVMWEIFSLGNVPYPETNANQSLYLKLKDGYRMEKPTYANNYLYNIMLDCWNADPERRPLFGVLKERLAVILGEEATNHFINLNEPFVKINNEFIKRNPTSYCNLIVDYPDELTQQHPPFFHGLPADPTSDNADCSATNPDDNSATNVKESPRIPTEIVDIANQRTNNLSSLYSVVKKQSRKKNEDMEPAREEIPMLHNTNQGNESHYAAIM